MDIAIHNVGEIRMSTIRKEDGYEVRKVFITTDKEDGEKEVEITCFTRTDSDNRLTVKLSEEREV